MPKKKIDYASMFTLRKDGRYMATWTDDDGQRRCLYDRDPETLYNKFQAALNAEPEPVKFREIAEAWKDSHWPKIAHGTQVCYSPAFDRAVALMGDRPASDIRPTDIQSHLEKLKNAGYSVKVIRTQKTVYHLIYAHAMLDAKYGETIKSDPSSPTVVPRGAKKAVKRDAPTDDVINQIRSRASEAYWGLFCLFLVSTGLRRGEALALQWKDIDFDTKRISVTKTMHFSGPEKIGQTKTESGVREVPILPDLLPLLKAESKKAKKKSDYVFHGEDPSIPMPENAYKRHWLHYCKDMGFVTDTPTTFKNSRGRVCVKHNYKPTLTAHVLRHGYATMLYDAGVDAYTAQKLLGHADIQTTMAIYTHLKQERENASISKLEEYVTQAIQ